jgi:hypothetical protein
LSPRWLGSIAALVNNVAAVGSCPLFIAVGFPQPLTSMADGDWDHVVATNLTREGTHISPSFRSGASASRRK